MAQAFLALVDEGLHAFNVATFFARDATTAGDRDALYAAILSAARTLPMMAPRRLVVVHDAEALLTPKRVKDEEAAEAGPKGKRAEAATPAEEFEAYLQRPEPTTTLVLETAGARPRTARDQAAAGARGGRQLRRAETAEDVARWLAAASIATRCASSRRRCGALVDAVGLDLAGATPQRGRQAGALRGRGVDDHRGPCPRRGHAGRRVERASSRSSTS